jgi:uncharacterized protein YrzB (UPF0473 family)
MSTKEQILAEMDGLSQEELEELYVLVKQFLQTQRQTQEEATKNSIQMNAWDVLEEMTGTIPAPEDWAVEHDRYLYGTPKRQD